MTAHARVGTQKTEPALNEIFAMLEATYGGETWHWYAEHVHGPMDVIAGAVLVQHTNWRNAERALEQLRTAGALHAGALLSLPEAQLIELVRSSGTPTIKAKRLRALAQTIADAGDLDKLFALADSDLRQRLLATHGVGEETADAIMLYAAGRRAFEVDVYAKRLFRRIGTGPTGDRYRDWQRFFEDSLPDADAGAFQRHHAHIVLHGKAVCRVRPRCHDCPLLNTCDHGRATARQPMAKGS